MSANHAFTRHHAHEIFVCLHDISFVRANFGVFIRPQIPYGYTGETSDCETEYVWDTGVDLIPGFGVHISTQIDV